MILSGTNRKSHGHNSGILTKFQKISGFCATLFAIGCTWVCDI